MSFVADYMIRSIAVVTSKMEIIPWEDVCKVSRDYAVTAPKYYANESRQTPERPFRFVYFSGLATVRIKA